MFLELFKEFVFDEGDCVDDETEEEEDNSGNIVGIASHVKNPDNSGGER